MEAKFGKGKVSPFPAVENHKVHLNFGGGGTPPVLETSSLLALKVRAPKGNFILH